MKKIKAYYATGLFSESDRMYNSYVVSQIRERIDNLDIYLPQENTDINDKSKHADGQMIAYADYKRLDNANILLVNLYGLETGQGRCLEMGYAYAKGIPIIGLWTDNRQQGADVKEKIEALKEIGENQFAYINLMVTGTIKANGKLVNNVDDFVDAIEEEVNRYDG